MSDGQAADTAPPPEAFEVLAQAVGALLGADATVSTAYGEVTVTTTAKAILDVLVRLRDDKRLAFVQLIDLTAVDYPERVARFDVVYHLLSPTANARVRVRLSVEEDEPVPTAIPVFPTANWLEREVFDMYGIAFTDHPDLRRILTDYGFQGFPLRKDFPMTGHVEVRYDVELKRVVYEPVKLTQDFRSFDFMSPWEGAPYILPGDEKARTNS